jgi:potassium channel subfamily K
MNFKPEIFTGMVFGGLILSKVAYYIVEKQEIFVVKAMHKAEKFDPEEISKELGTNKSKYKLLLAKSTFLVLMIVGIVFLYDIGKLDFVNALN